MPLLLFFRNCLISSSAIAAAASATVTTTTVATATAASAAVAATTITAAATAAISTTTTTATVTTATAAAAAVSTATAAATIAAATATAISTVTATAAASGFVRFFHGHLFSTDGGIIQRFDRSLRLGLIRHIYKPEAFASSRLPIHYDLCEIHCAIQFEHFFQVHIIEIIGKTCYKKLHANKFKR
jgi:hypothetical protein